MSVSIRIHDDTALVSVDTVERGTIAHDDRLALLQAVAYTEAASAIQRIVVHFTPTPLDDISRVIEMNTADTPPLSDVMRRIIHAKKTWIAVLDGEQVGAFLEIALTCRYRLATRKTRLGFPDIHIGLIPEGGATALLTRVVPAINALDMIATGKLIAADDALQIGLIDHILDGEIIEAALAYANDTFANTSTASVLRRPSVSIADKAAFDFAEQKIKQRYRGHIAQNEAIRLIKKSMSTDTDAALKDAIESAQLLRKGPQASALQHIYQAEENAKRRQKSTAHPPRPLNQIGVIGGGTMGAGIAAACLMAGFSVTMIERDSDAVTIGTEKLFSILDTSMRRGIISAEKMTQLRSAFHASDRYPDLRKADLVIEAVFEDIKVKTDVFSKLVSVTRPDTILATNTSYLDVNLIANTLADPSRVIGLHFFSPAHIMKLLEIIVTDHVSGDVLATGIDLAKRLNKIPVLSGVCDGFIANRLMTAYRQECDYMLLDGALPWDIDRAMVAFGFPMGLYQMQDLAGLDISWAMRKRLAKTRKPIVRYVKVADKLCEMGRFGRKTGRGWYQYNNGNIRPDPDVEQLIYAESADKGIIRTTITDADIMDRILATIQTEADKILAEGIANNRDDIDVVMVNAYGFPRWKGGPMYMQKR